MKEQYEVGLLLKKKFKMALFNPLLIAILCVMGMLQLMQVDYKTYNAGGQYISYLLTPATVCLAVPLYSCLSCPESPGCHLASLHQWRWLSRNALLLH